MEAHKEELHKKLKGSRILVIGAAGSIGVSVVYNLLPYGCASLTLVDLSENNLVEVIRHLRSDPNMVVPEDTELLPLSYGSTEFKRYLKDSEPYDYIMNLSAIKHVRSEKNIYSIYRMYKTNVLYLNELLESIDYTPKKVFSVSSDKAVYPANLMGASKMSMELTLLAHSHKFPVSSARFANVAFSYGSLPYGFLERIKKNQCLSAPDNIKRFFISHEESGQLCVLATVLGNNGDIFYPNLQSHLNEKKFTEIAVELLESMVYTPKHCQSEDEAKRAAQARGDSKEWPCYFSPAQTSGEKAYEEFYTEEEEKDENRFQHIGVVKKNQEDVPREAFKSFLSYLGEMIHSQELTKADIVKEVSKIVPTLKHKETGKSLDQQM